jgi:hypothetical protein
MTEPQRISGTRLGYSVYPYSFSFEDRFVKRDFNQKLVVFVLQDTKYIEVRHKLYEKKFADYEVSRDFVDNTLKNIISLYPNLVDDREKVEKFFIRENAYNEVLKKNT